MTKHTNLVVKNALRQVEISTLQVDNSYQRQLNNKAINKIAKNYDPVAFGIPLVGERNDGSLWIVDGQQRIGFLRSDKKYKWVRVEVFASKGPEHEAEVFRLVNKNRTPLKPIEMFHALLTAGDEDMWSIKEIIEKAGFKIPRGESKGVQESHENRSLKIHCIGAVSRVYRDCGKEGLEFILNVLSKIWDNDHNRTSDAIIGGLGSFYNNREKVVDIDRLVVRLAKTTPNKILYSAQLGVGNRHSVVSQLIDKFYRKNKV